MSSKPKKPLTKPKASPGKPVAASVSSTSTWLFLAPVLAFTFVLYLPMFKNGFTNWDDVLYVTSNPLLKNLNAEGLKAIFSTPVVSNYHPLTILSLALNYQAGELSPTSYWITNILLHIINTGLVFWFVSQLTSGNRWVSAFVSLLFAIHPMHVESVAWISERKDLLYTLFYVLALISYVKYVDSKKIKFLVFTTLLGAISLLCKPAAIVLPLSLIMIDYFRKREWNIRWILEKIPLFLLCGVMAYVTFAIQSKKAVAAVEAYNMIDRLSFGGFGWIWYLLKLIVPVPLSALHPFPLAVTPIYYVATLASVAIVVYALLKIKNRNFLFGFGFYTVNLLLVLQVVSIGNAVVAERYTYVPYIGIFFWMAMEGYKLIHGKLASYKTAIIAIVGIWILVMAWMTYQRIPVWHDSQALWQNVLDTYPESRRGWTNKGLDFYTQQKYPECVDHLTRALAIDPNYPDAVEWRARAYLEMNDGAKALEDVNHFLKIRPNSEAGLFLLGRCYELVGRAEEAVNVYSGLITQYDKAEYYNNRGTLYFNAMKRYADAKSDFE
ncbi:MAG TPA: tetratricopeptide repeat protein, partial [Saprospiraceae bacterium]|nr:tetratricopeptide repeat protein [Saprospiraceae bacterium]